MTSYGPLPSADDIKTFLYDTEKVPLYGEAVGHYLSALEFDSESAIATELYKVVEIIEEAYGGEKTAPTKLGYPPRDWSSLKRNLNWGLRHIPGKFQPPRRKLSVNELFGRVREIMERYRERQKKDLGLSDAQGDGCHRERS